jgi:CRISPR-associated protein Csb1
MKGTALLNLQIVEQAVSGSAAAFRCITEYEPAGGPDAAIFPPTYEGGRYALVGSRRIKPQDALEADIWLADRVIIDSVQSQANRMELALLRAWEEGRIRLPVITVDFSGYDLPKNLRITSLEAPHRIADALLRDSRHNGTRFRESIGKLLDQTDQRNATELFAFCPTALLFGMWDSTGPQGGLGAKFQRALVSEIIGIDVQIGKKTSSRIDPAGIQLDAGPLYATPENSSEGSWTLDESKARRDNKGPVKFRRTGRPSEANHGNVTPTIGDGGVYVGRIVQTTVLSLCALRRLRFPINQQYDVQRDIAARTALAALGLCAAALARLDGDLRSRCQIVPKTPYRWQLLDDPEKDPTTYELPPDNAIQLLTQAIENAKRLGLPWHEEEIRLEPLPQLAELVKKSQELAATIVSGEDQ